MRKRGRAAMRRQRSGGSQKTLTESSSFSDSTGSDGGPSSASETRVSSWPLSASEQAGASAAAIAATRGEPAERSPRGVKPTTKHRGGAELLCGLWCVAGPPAPPSGGGRAYQSLSVRLAPRRPSQGGVARR